MAKAFRAMMEESLAPIHEELIEVKNEMNNNFNDVEAQTKQDRENTFKMITATSNQIKKI